MAATTGRTRDPFHFRLSLAILAVAVLGFLPSYWWPLALGKSPRTVLHHIHGVVLFAWFALLAWQAWLVLNGRTARHREVGLAGIAIGTLAVALGWALAIVSLRFRIGTIGLVQAGNFFVFNAVDISLFTLYFAAAIAYVGTPAVHRRLIIAASVATLSVAVFRWTSLLGLPVPWGDLLPAMLGDLLLLPLVAHDLRTLGRVHGATWAALMVIPAHLLEVTVANSADVTSVALWFARIGG